MAVLFGLVIGSVLVIVLTSLLTRFRVTIQQILTTRRAAQQFPYLTPHWLLGNFDQASDPEKFAELYQKLTEKYNRLFVFWSGPLRPVLTLVHPETVKPILKTTEPKTFSLGAGYRLLEDWIGDGLLLSRGPVWERNRKLITPAFHFAILKSYVNKYNPAIRTFLTKLENERDEYVEISDATGLLTLDIMLRCAFSYEGNVQEQGKTHPYVVAVHRLSDLILRRSKLPHLHIKALYNLTEDGKKWQKMCDYVHNFSRDIIETRRKTLENNPEALKRRHLDFLDILLTAKDDNNVGMTDLELRNEVDTFLFAGHDTTNSTISWALYALAKYPDVQEKVYKEVKSVLGSREDIEWEDFQKFEYMKLVIKEVLRMFSPVYQISRQLTKDCVIDGYHVPAGMCIDINIMNMNHNPSVWKDHDVFDPERFSGDDLAERDPFQFVPFSAGPRNCIGQNFGMNEVKSVIALTLQRFELQIDPNHQYIPIPFVVIRAKYGIKLKLLPRKR